MSRKRGLDANSGRAGPIPERWLNCPRKATNLIGGKFIAFKTPLDSKFDSQVSDEYIFHPEMMFTATKTMKQKLGLWIDLTNSKRFYDSSIIEKHDCKYTKLSCRGHGETPSPDSVDLFINICLNFIRKNPLHIIGVHCTHGFNRTGFLIVSYLVRELDWSVEAAVAEFAKIRPPGIYKADYLAELFRLYGDIEDTPQAPALPMWHTECDDTSDNEAEEAVDQAGTSNGEPVVKKRREMIQQKAVFMDGVPNVKPVADMELTASVQSRIKALTGFSSSGFPGCQPVSMDRKNVALLESPYMVSWKADGTRYLMYIKGPFQIYFIDRENAVFQIEGLSFVSLRDRNRHLVDTLVDGEMVIDTEAGGQKTPRYLIYDLISLEGSKTLSYNFPTRYRAIKNELIVPRIESMKEGRIHREREPIGIRRKEFWETSYTRDLLSDKFKNALSHEPDGLIYQPVDAPYTPGPCQSVLKWKPPSLNSVDFRLKIVEEERPGYLRKKRGDLYVGGKDVPFAQIELTRELKLLNNAIIECRWVSSGEGPPNKTGWVFMRQRTDKSFPNSIKTAQAVCASIMEPVTEDWLISYINTHSPRTEPLTSMAPPSQPPPHRRPH